MSPKTYRIHYKSPAERALDETVGHITRKDGPDRAANWLRTMLVSIDALETMPRRFRQCGEWEGHVVHVQPVMSHLVYYVIIDQASVVSIIDIAGAGQQSIREQYETN